MLLSMLLMTGTLLYASRLTGAPHGPSRLARCETQSSKKPVELLPILAPLTPPGRVDEMYRLSPFFEIPGCVLRSVVLY